MVTMTVSLSEIRDNYATFCDEYLDWRPDYARGQFDEWLDLHTRTQIARTLENLHQRAYKLCGTNEDVLEYIREVAKAHREGFTVD